MPGLFRGSVFFAKTDPNLTSSTEPTRTSDFQTEPQKLKPNRPEPQKLKPNRNLRKQLLKNARPNPPKRF